MKQPLAVPSRGAHDVLDRYGWAVARAEGDIAIYRHRTEDRGHIAITRRDPASPYSAVRWTRTYPHGGVLRSDTLASLATHLVYDAHDMPVTGGDAT